MDAIEYRARYPCGTVKGEKTGQFFVARNEFGKRGCIGCARQARQTEMVRLRTALQKIADLIDSEADEPLDDAIRIATEALNQK